MPCMPRLMELLDDRDCGCSVCMWKFLWYLSVTKGLVYHAGGAGRIPGILSHPSTAVRAVTCQPMRWQNLMTAALLTGPTPPEHLCGRNRDRIHKGLETCPGAQGPPFPFRHELLQPNGCPMRLFIQRMCRGSAEEDVSSAEEDVSGCR